MKNCSFCNIIILGLHDISPLDWEKCYELAFLKSRWYDLAYLGVISSVERAKGISIQKWFACDPESSNSIPIASSFLVWNCRFHIPKQPSVCKTDDKMTYQSYIVRKLQFESLWNIFSKKNTKNYILTPNFVSLYKLTV